MAKLKLPLDQARHRLTPWNKKNVQFAIIGASVDNGFLVLDLEGENIPDCEYVKEGEKKEEVVFLCTETIFEPES